MPSLRPLTIAFMGNFSAEKGSKNFPKLVELCSEAKLPIKWWILGGIGDEESYQRASSFAEIQTTGFYSTTELPELIKSLKLDLGLIMSVFPESYSKLSRECWQAGLPLIYNKIGVLDSISFSDFGVKDVQRHLDTVVKKITKIAEDPNLLDKEKQKVEKAIQENGLLSANDKHLRYLQLYLRDHSE